MRVSIDHSEEQTGLLRKTTHYQVSASIKFSEEEIAIIKGLHLQDHVVVERNATSTVKDADDLDIWNLTCPRLGSKYQGCRRS